MRWGCAQETLINERQVAPINSPRVDSFHIFPMHCVVRGIAIHPPFYTEIEAPRQETPLHAQSGNTVGQTWRAGVWLQACTDSSYRGRQCAHLSQLPVTLGTALSFPWRAGSTDTHSIWTTNGLLRTQGPGLSL